MDVSEEFSKKRNLPIPTPEELHEHLNDYVIGQEEAKKALSVAVYNHYKRIDQKKDDVDIEKSNILMVGPTGCGKTLIAKSLAKKLNVPFTMANATSLTEAGYIGEDVENILMRLITKAGFNLEEAERGIVYIDEIDKIGKKNGGSNNRDVSGEGVQQGLLQIIEGADIHINRKMQEPVQINTKNILFICGGAFDGLEEVIKERITGNSIGFAQAEKVEQSKEIATKDFVSFGLIPELLGRLPVIAQLNELTHEDLVNILLWPKNSLIRQYKKLLRLDGVELVFTDAAITEIVSLGEKRELGARGLRAIMEDLMLDTMYSIPKKNIKKCTITKGVVTKGEKPTLVEGEA